MRACPMHLGHQAIVNAMVRDAGDMEHCLLFLGSSNRPLSFKYLFSFRERHEIARTLFPKLRILGIPDFPNDEDWLFNLNNELEHLGTSLANVTFYGGCHEDIAWFIDRGFATKIINRFSGAESPIVSATQVRDALLEGRSLDGLVDTCIHAQVRTLFSDALSRLKQS